MNAMAAAVALIAILSSVASAEPADSTPDQTVISLPLLALSSNAIAVQGERPVGPRTSLALAVGLRDGADGDYQSTSVGLGVELRVWLSRSQRGLFVGPRVEMAVTRVSMSARGLGTAIVLTEAGLLGYRFVIAGRVEITPEVGFALRHDLVAGGVPDANRTTPVYGVTAGWVFH